MVPMTFTLVLLHDDVMLPGRRDFAGGQRASLESGKIPRLDPIKLVDVILNNYFQEEICLAPSPGRREGQECQFSQFIQDFPAFPGLMPTVFLP